MRIYSFLFLFAISSIFSCDNKNENPDLIIHNAEIWTADETYKFAEATAVLGDKILAIGENDEILNLKSFNTTVIDAERKFIVPGFIDSHVHLMTGGRSLLSVDLRDAHSPEEFSNRVASFAKSLDKGEWILEGNWDHTLWGGDLPHRDWIDEVTEDIPILLFRLDGHMALANTAALEFAGINRNTPIVYGGTIIKDENGELTGLLKDNAMNLVMDKIPSMTTAQKYNSFNAAMDYFLSNGVTSVHDVDGQNGDVESYTTALKFLEEEKLKVRIYASAPLQHWESSVTNSTNNDWIKLGSLKGFVDGSLGSHTAAFHDHYTDKQNDKGFFINKEEGLYRWISKADSAGLHILVHAIGDSAIHTLLNIYEKVIKENGQKDRRFRIEHAQHLAPEDIDRFAKLGVIASMQPYHAIDDGRWAEEYIGPERIKTTYAFNSLLKANTTLAFGSDWAVAPASPLLGIHAAVMRQTLDGKNPEGWVPDQRIKIEDALKAYTIKAAYASFDESRKGSLEKGKLADFVFLSKNILKINPSDIKETKVLHTYVAGQEVFSYNN